ncbi:hypothetical protein GQ457_09G006570 [Hibiscus cannabinus]
MGCLYSGFDVKKQGKTVWVVRARNWKLRGGENRLSGLLEGIASVEKARRQEGSNITFVQPLLGHESDPILFRRPIGTRSFRCVVNHHRMVVYRSWIFGFDSGIPRVTISGRFCNWTGSRGLHKK